MKAGLFWPGVVILCVAVSEGFVSRIRRLSEPPDRACRTAQAECSDEFLSPYTLPYLQDVQQFMANRTLLEKASSDMEAAAGCYEDAVAELGCDFLQEDILVVDFYAGYFSTPGVVDNLIEASASGCFTSESKAQEMAAAFVSCDQALEASDRRGEDQCSSFMQLWACWEQGAATHCGQPVADMITKFKQYALTTSTAPGFLQYLTDHTGLNVSHCGDEVILTRRFVKRIPFPP
ncbi:hypothetical protein PoB_003126600 [Plakobranchus ocellatus]|uniref:Secreted protein n=1 Tax=Plakobranchus ocellatus TaxID=259542 RepID=A0AAV4A904_9GAST|nr:hypothetical protein PoB_003126600 [Plakobranchus ocellatus]